MMSSEELFLQSIGITNLEKYKDYKIIDVTLNERKREFNVKMALPEVVIPEDIDGLWMAGRRGINGNIKVNLELFQEKRNPEEIIKIFKYVLNDFTKMKPSLIGVVDNNVTLDDDILVLEVNTKVEEKMILDSVKVLVSKLELYGIRDVNITTVVSETKQEEIKNLIASSHEEVKVKEKTPIIMGKHIDGEITSINEIMGEMRNVVVEGFIFGEIGTLEKEKINIITLKFSDKTNSILVKIFKKDHDEFLSVMEEMKAGTWYRVHGNVEFDNYAKELVLVVRNMEHIASKDSKAKDEAEVKRVELHTHTMMSAMDGVIPAEALVKYAYNLGHKAIAVTDHNCVQSFPELYHTVEALNKGKDAKDHFKVLYGTELNVVNDDIDVVFNLQEYNLLDQEYVVFDTETTGFYAGSDQMIEIGAVKIKNNEVLDRFDALIDPHRPLPQKIADLTYITDEMLKGKEDEDVVTKKFLDWVGDLPLVAHNAKFDISFMRAACNKYNLGEFRATVLDTMSMARMLHPDWPNHKLSTLTRKLNIPWDEDKHHRADYDAEGTAYAFYKFCKEFDAQNISTTTKLVASIDTESLVKFAYPFHVTIIAKDRGGLKNLFKIISMANTKYLYKNDQPKIPRREINNLREGLLIGSSCINNEIFEKAGSLEDEELVNMMSFYDYIEVQPLSVFSHLIGPERKFNSEVEAENYLKRIIRVAKEAGKPVVATGDVHNLTKEDLIYREIIINQKFNGKLHPLNRKGLKVPNMYLKTTDEMLEEFSFLGEELAYEIVVANTNKIAEMVGEIEVIIATPKPFAPKIPNSIETMTELVYTKARDWYGEVLPYHIEDRLAKELYGDSLKEAITYYVNKDESITDKDKEIYAILHKTIVGGYNSVKDYIKEYLKDTLEEIPDDEELDKEAKKKLGGIIGAGYDVIYLIAQKLVKHSNDEGFLVGSRGSVGSSFVACMMGITEVNSLAAHYRCGKCKLSIFNDEEGNPLGSTYSSGFDLPDKKCPHCDIPMIKDGQDIPFATFLGFNADKVPDIDLNFSDLNQASAHEYTKVLFGVDNVYRAGTIGTVAEKTAYGYVRGYCEEKGIIMRNLEIERLAMGCTGVKRTTGQHPGGIVVIPGYMEVYDFTPFQYPADDPTSAWRTTHFDYHAIDADVLKLDILGHTDPTQLRMIQDLTGDDITKVPLDDKATMSIFTSTKALGVTPEQIMCETGTLGVPEFGTPFTISLVKDTKPTTFAELIKISGLSHGTDVWLGNAQELIANNVVPFSKVIGCRDDIMVDLMYQGLPPFKAFKIMEFVRKGRASKPKDHEEWEGYVKLMQEYNVEDWFIDSCAKIKYMFPKAHAAAYVTSAFRIAWYKVHKPIIYYASYFSTRFDDFDLEVMVKGYDTIKAKMAELMAKGYDATNKESSLLETLKLALEATARGIKFSNIDIEKSDGKNFVIGDEHTLICPFKVLDGLGDSVATKIIEERNIQPFISIEDLQSRGKVSSTTIDKLRTLGVLDGLPETSQLSLF